MKIVDRLPLLLCLLACSGFFGFKRVFNTTLSQSANTISFGGASVVVDMTDCSPDNSSDGKSRAIAAINSSTASMCTLQFGTLEPANGAYLTIQEEPIGEGQVILGGAGSSFGGGFIAAAGQGVIITSGQGKYHAAFKDITLLDPATKKMTGKKISGSFGCH